MTQSSDEDTAAGLQHPQPLRVSRTFHARRETVFTAWSTADHVKNWFSPRTYSIPDARVEMHVGGAFEVCMLSPVGKTHWTRGRFVEVTPHSHLVIDMHASDLLASMQLNGQNGGTKLVVTEDGVFLDGYDDAGSREHGTVYLLDRLGAWLRDGAIDC